MYCTREEDRETNDMGTNSELEREKNRGVRALPSSGTFFHRWRAILFSDFPFVFKVSDHSSNQKR